MKVLKNLNHIQTATVTNIVTRFWEFLRPTTFILESSISRVAVMGTFEGTKSLACPITSL
ncbi:hypothetical protein C0J52_25638 [Blattella germanica]|nr:hypothetical protein C0J52_25638 [Blattella germanica]